MRSKKCILKNNGKKTFNCNIFCVFLSVQVQLGSFSNLKLKVKGTEAADAKVERKGVKQRRFRGERRGVKGQG